MSATQATNPQLAHGDAQPETPAAQQLTLLSVVIPARDEAGCIAWSDRLLVTRMEMDEQMDLMCGEVLASSRSRDEIYRKLLDVSGRKVAIEYTGEIPEDLAVML